MYNHELIFENQLFEAGMTLPANTNANANKAMRADGTSGRLAIVVQAADDAVALADTRTFTLRYTEADTEGGSYSAPTPETSLVFTASGAYAPNKGDVIARLLLPVDVKKWVKANLATSDGSAAGTVNVVLAYVGG